MNATQKKYAKERIEKLANKKINNLAIPKKPNIELSFEEKYELLSKGKVKLRSIDECRKYQWKSSFDDVDECFDFILPVAIKRKHEKLMREYEKLNKKYTETVSSIKKESQIIIDQIYLGDSELALDMIAKFENKSF